MSPTYRIDSWASWSITDRATVRPPKPESKIPIGASRSGWAEPSGEGEPRDETDCTIVKARPKHRLFAVLGVTRDIPEIHLTFMSARGKCC
ncbi:hypothetical protein GCM10007979_30020 [Nocardioides albus]|nr:hypothetical protein GCM10007979_30020 [Nocardioides albus]